MSRHATEWAWNCPLKGTLKLVLLFLADAANENEECWPGRKYIAQQCGISERTLSSHINTLVQEKYISIKYTHSEDGHRTGSLYKLNTSLSANIACRHSLSANIACRHYIEPIVCSNINHNNKTNNIYTSNTSNDMTKIEQFELFWNLYPNKYSKGRAKQVWHSLHLTDKKVDIILTSLNNQIFEREIKALLGCFVPHWLAPANWLSQEGWENEALTDVWDIKEKFDKGTRSNEEEQKLNLELALRASGRTKTTKEAVR